MKKFLHHCEQHQSIGKCDCGGTIIFFRQELTVEAGGQVITRVEFDCFCTNCGDNFAVTEKPTPVSA